MKYQIAAAAVVAASLPARAGVTLVSTGSHGGHATTTTVELDGDKVRVVSDAERGGMTMYFDAATKTMTMVDAAKKTYRQLTPADMKQIRVQADAMKAQMASRLAALPPEQRAQMEAMMAQHGGGMTRKVPERTYVSMGTKRSVGGFACEDFKILVDGVEREQECVSKYGAGIVKEADVAPFKKLAEEFASGVGVDAASSWAKAPGIPIERTRLGANGEKEVVEQLQSAKRGSIPADHFAVPAGYTKEDSPMFGPGAHGHGPHAPGQ